MGVFFGVFPGILIRNALDSAVSGFKTQTAKGSFAG